MTTTRTDRFAALGEDAAATDLEREEEAMSNARNAARGAARFLDACLGIEYAVDPDERCPGAPPVVLGKCQKPGPHGPHRCGDPPVYEKP